MAKVDEVNRADVHAYWRDPESDTAGASSEYKAVCKPEWYIPLKAVSEMWLEVFERYVPKDATILELGCSVGRNLYYLRQAGYQWLAGVEINPKAKELSAASFGQDTADLITVSTIESYLPTIDECDVVFTSGVLMHIHPDSEWIFSSMARGAQNYLMVAEVERTNYFYKWSRDYRAIFEGFGLKQIHEQIAAPMSGNTILRVFEKCPAS